MMKLRMTLPLQGQAQEQGQSTSRRTLKLTLPTAPAMPALTRRYLGCCEQASSAKSHAHSHTHA